MKETDTKRTKKLVLTAANNIADNRDIIYGLCEKAEREIKSCGNLKEVLNILQKIQSETVSLAKTEDKLFAMGQVIKF